MNDIDVLICYRGRFRVQVEHLDKLLSEHNLSASFDAEILTPDVEYTDAVIEWISLGSSEDDDDVSWRGPISEAVKRSTLIVFLIDTQDRSENVMNEIAWAARAERPLFIVFNTEGDGHSEDWEGMQLGMLQAYYGMIAQNPEVSHFGWHFITHEENDGLQDRLTILVNRIVSYLDAVKRDAVPRFRMDEQYTVQDLEASPQYVARRKLHHIQEKMAKTIGMQPSSTDMLQLTLQKLHDRERDGETRNGRIYPKHSPFSYPEESERERYRRTEALINAIRPGPFESPDFLVMFGRELVSLEMTLNRTIRPATLIGTIAFTPSNLCVDTALGQDHCVLLVDSSQSDYAYQMIKSVVMSWKIVSPPNRLPVAMSSRSEDTSQVIQDNPDRVAGFAHSLQQMLTRGLPRSSTSGPPAAAYQPTLTMLLVYQKRFCIAVALARVLILDDSSRQLAPADLVLEADSFAARLIFESAATLDSTDPTVAYQAIMIWLAAQSLIERGLDGVSALEAVPAAKRADAVTSVFFHHLVQRPMPKQAAEQQTHQVRDSAATVEVLRQAAIAAGHLSPKGMKPTGRWERNASQHP